MLAENSKYLRESKNYSVTEDGRIYSHSRVDRAKPYNRQAIVDSNKRRSMVCGL